MSNQRRIPAEVLAEAMVTAGVGCWLWDPETSYLQISENFHELLGYPSDALPETPEAWLALAHIDDRQRLGALFEHLSNNATHGHPGFSLRLKHGSGLWHWFEVRPPAAGQEASIGPTVITFIEITQQKQAEAALRDSQLRFRALYNTSPLAFILWNREGSITEWNRRAEMMFGWRSEEVIGKRVHRLLLPDEQHTTFTEVVRAVMRGSGDGIYVGPALGKNGLLLHCNWYNVALRSANGKLLGILSLVLDITDERLAHYQLEKSEKVYRTLVETSPDAILLLSLDGRLQMANQQAHRLFGLDEMDDLSARRIGDLLPANAEDASEAAGLLDSPEEFNGFIVNRELPMQRVGGTRFDAATAFTTIMDSSGRSSGIVLFVRDITDKLHAERELEAHRENLERLVQERTAELETARGSLAKIIEASPVPTLVLDENHTVTHWNTACEQIIGVPASDMIGTRDSWKAFYSAQRPIMADLVMAGKMAGIESLYAGKFRQSELVQGAFEGEDYFPKFNRWLFFTAAPLRDKRGKIVGAIETLQDITERKLAEIALTEAKQVAESAANTKAEFLANMSHEIRTPMNAVIGLAHLLLKSELSAKQRDFVARIHNAGQMLLGLINDILDFSKIEAGRMQLEATEFVLDEVLDNVASVLLHRAQEKGLALQYLVEPEVPPRLVGDPLRLAQILINLIGNALKFTANGSVTVFVRRVPCDSCSVMLELDVQDTGIGLSQEQQQNLFQAFTQADTSITRKYGGTGLGLTICKRLSQLMDGDIWVTSQPGVGSTFTFAVKLGLGSEHEVGPRAAMSRALVVDDSPLSRAILIRLFEKNGYTAVPAESGAQALQLLAEARVAPFKFVTIDLNMPGMDGLELAESIRSQTLLPPKLVMVTAADTALLEGDRRLGCFDVVINKPVTATQIGKLVAESHQNSPSALPTHAARLAGLRVLLVDDMPTNQLIACEILESFGITVDTADNGARALKKLLEEANIYDIVLMDVQMPEMDGLEATRRLRASKRVPDLPIIAMTAHALDSERQRCLAAGMNDFLTKPIDPELLQHMLSRWQPKQASSNHAQIQETTSMTSTDGFPDLPGIDKAEGLKRMMNKATLYEKVLRDFYARFKDEPTLIRTALATGDFSTAERRAHSTKGLAGTIGALGLQNAAKVLEDALHAGEMPSESIFGQFEGELGIVIESIARGFAIDQAG